MGNIGIIHSVAGILSIILGAIVLLRTKGGTIHRRVGYFYVACMVVLNSTAFAIYRVFDGIGPFHAFAVVCVISLIQGVFAAVRRKGDWKRRHYNGMCWSYIGLMSATSAEIVLRVPVIQRLGLIGFSLIFVCPIIVVLIGRTILARNRDRILSRSNSTAD